MCVRVCAHRAWGRPRGARHPSGSQGSASQRESGVRCFTLASDIVSSCMGVFPSLFLFFMELPNTSSVHRARRLPLAAARCKGVLPSSSTASTAAPRLARASSTAGCPAEAAKWRAVLSESAGLTALVVVVETRRPAAP